MLPVKIPCKDGEKHLQMHTDPKNSLQTSQELMLLPRNHAFHHIVKNNMIGTCNF